jgi:hypothetical protein
VLIVLIVVVVVAILTWPFQRRGSGYRVDVVCFITRRRVIDECHAYHIPFPGDLDWAVLRVKWSKRDQ